MTPRTLALPLAAALALTLVGPSPAQAASTTLGSVAQIAAGTAPTQNTQDQTVVQTAAATSSYTVPAAGGVITRYQHRAGAAGGALTFKVFRPAAPAGSFLVVSSELRTVAANATASFDVRIPVKGGDLLGLSTNDVDFAYATGAAGDQIAFLSADGATGSTVTTATAGPGFQLDVTAVVEPDADADGFGDETQDKCASDVRTAGPCVETTLVKGPGSKVRTKKRKAKVTITVAGADSSFAFQCSVDGAAFQGCAPTFEKKYKRGKHTVQVRAINAQGVADSKHVSVTFKVKRKK